MKNIFSFSETENMFHMHNFPEELCQSPFFFNAQASIERASSNADLLLKRREQIFFAVRLREPYICPNHMALKNERLQVHSGLPCIKQTRSGMGYPTLFLHTPEIFSTN